MYCYCCSILSVILRLPAARYLSTLFSFHVSLSFCSDRLVPHLNQAHALRLVAKSLQWLGQEHVIRRRVFRPPGFVPRRQEQLEYWPRWCPLDSDSRI